MPEPSPFVARHHLSPEGNPAGGYARAAGVSIEWQNGPTVVDGVDIGQNGAFVQTIIQICVDRLEHYQTTRFACAENQAAIDSLNEAFAHLQSRFDKRAADGILGTHTVGEEPAEAVS